MPEPPGQPRFAPCYEDSFDADRRALGLSGKNFDHFFNDIEAHAGDYPWEASAEVPNSGGIRMMPTECTAPDIPALYVYYGVQTAPNRIIFLGLSIAWSRADLPAW